MDDAAGTTGESQAGGGGEGPPRRNERRTFLGSLKWAFAMNWGQRSLSAVFTVILAAMLGPHDFGVVAIALVYIGFMHVFLEQGVSTAVIQREDLEPDHLDAAFWMNLAACVVLAGITVAVSGWWAEVNGAPELQQVLSVLSLVLVIEGLLIVQDAYLQRRGRYKSLAWIWNVAALVGGILGITLALAGAGVWALVAQFLALDGSALLLTWIVSQWKPAFRFSRRHARDLLGFSSHVLLANLGGFVNRRADALLVGVFFGPVVVGVYRLADRFVDLLLDLTMRPVGMVSLPFFSRLQHDRENLRNAVATCMRVTLLACVPALLVLAACSDFVLAVMGPEWAAGADALKLLALAGIGKAIISFTGPLLFAVGKPAFRAVMLWVLGAASAGTVVAVASLLDSASEDRQIFGVALSRALLFLVVFVPVNLVIVQRVTRFGLRDFLTMAAAPTAAGTAAVAVVFLLREATAIESLPPFVGLLIAGALAVGTAGGVMLLLDKRSREYLRALRGLASSYRPSAPSAPGS